MNSVALIGRLTADPTAHTGESHETCTFGLAVPRPASDGADFVDVVRFDKLAACCAHYLSKGREVAVVGRLRLDEWNGRDGERRVQDPGGGRRRPVPRQADQGGRARRRHGHAYRRKAS